MSSNARVTVHHYARKGLVPPSTASLVQAGWNIARHTSIQSWCNVIAHIPPDTLEIGRNTYRYVLPPPLISLGEDASPTFIPPESKEWGHDLYEDEMYTISELPDFQSGLSRYQMSQAQLPLHAPFIISTDLVSASTKLRPGENLLSQSRKFSREQTDVSSITPTSKPEANMLITSASTSNNAHDHIGSAIQDPREAISMMQSTRKENMTPNPSISMFEPPGSGSQNVDLHFTDVLYAPGLVPIGEDLTMTGDEGGLFKGDALTTFQSACPQDFHHEQPFLTYTFTGESSIPGLSYANKDVNPKDSSMESRQWPSYLNLQSTSLNIIPNISGLAALAGDHMNIDSDGQEQQPEDSDSIFGSSESWAREDSEDPAIVIHREATRNIHEDFDIYGDQDNYESSSASSDNRSKSLAYLVKPYLEVEEDSIYGTQRSANAEVAEAIQETHDLRSSHEEREGETRYIEHDSIISLIPYPHFYVAPEAQFTDDLDEGPSTAAPYYFSFEHEPLPIPPHSPDTVSELLQRPFARCAWVIPVRGVPPWTGASEASVISDPSGIQPEAFSTSSRRSTIIWGAESLRAFWGYLLSVREAGTCGPLGLSFQVARPVRRRASAAAEESGSSGGGRPRPPPSLAALDHIKVHLDAAYAAQMRSMLDGWCYRSPVRGDSEADSSWDFDEGVPIYMSSEDGIEFGSRLEVEMYDGQEDADESRRHSDNEQQYLLRGALLPLVDERNRGILLG